MKSLMTKIASMFSGVALFALGCVMAGLGFAAISTLALFALAALGLGVLAAPFVALAQPNVPAQSRATETSPAA